MKFILTTIIIFLTLLANAQTKLIPAKNVVDKKWLKTNIAKWSGMKLKTLPNLKLVK